jgi:hypothetical protein
MIKGRDNWKNMELFEDSETPLPLTGFTLSFDDNDSKAYLYGGEGKFGGKSGELYELKLGGSSPSWKKIVTENTPTERSYHSMTEIIYENQERIMYIFGGAVGFWGKPSKSFYKLNIDKGTFTEIENKDGPSERWRHSMGIKHIKIGCVGKKVYIYGGDNNKGVFADLWVFSEKKGWKQIITKSYPQPRIYSNILSSNEDKKLYLIGGCKGNLTDPYKEFWEFDIKEGKWEQISIKFGSEPMNLPFWIPSKEFGCILVGKKILICGGETFLNDDEIKPILNDVLLFDIGK